MSTATAWAVLSGTGLGLGLWSLVSLSPRLRSPRLVDRVAPYVLDVSPQAREFLRRHSVDPLPVLGSLLTPLIGAVAGAFSRAIGGTDVVAQRLQQSGLRKSVEQFRTEQLAWALVGFAAGAGSLFLPVVHAAPASVQIAVPAVAAGAGAWARDWMLQRSARLRLSRINSELPTVLEFLTLSLSAGEGILDSLRRISTASSGELAREFSRVFADVHSGVPLADALGDLSRRIRLAPLTRALEQVMGALERGSPLGEVLRAQAQDSRDETKRRLLEIAGKKEVAMMIPLVFLILPLTVIFAIFPGIFVLQSGF
ncbi:type II secretion system F family protein [Cryobacterium tepidiphilum]|uniref:Pilus assembly protein n=1 Tax=Cryobacterium tepidiphilum TaxID=2486026 RepID=A0A3M8L0I4_9MICO|nr:type II secretion system F family protein [Cryobacterium tepidiphilum]RNE59023.1 pilus assembly protein [Cryobacterium tepidiphilum]